MKPSHSENPRRQRATPFVSKVFFPSPKSMRGARHCRSHEVLRQSNKNASGMLSRSMGSKPSSRRIVVSTEHRSTEDRQFINPNEFEWYSENETTIYSKIKLNMHAVVSDTPHSIDTYLRRANIRTVFSLSPYLFDTCICLCPPPARCWYADTTFYVCHVCRVWRWYVDFV